MKRKICLKKPKIALVSFSSHLNLLLPIVKILEDGGWECYFFVLHSGSFLTRNVSMSKEKLKEFFEFLEKNKIKAVGFSVTSLLFLRVLRNVVKLLRKKFPEIVIACGGPAVTSSPEDFVEIADIVWVGAIDNRFPKTLRKALGSKKGEVVVGKDQVEMDKIYDVDILEKIYQRVKNPNFFLSRTIYKKIYGINVQQRCFFGCSYCLDGFYKKFKKLHYGIRSVDNVIKELAWAKNKFGNFHVYFFMRCLPPRNWLKEFCRKYKKIGLPFSVPAHPIQLDLEMIKKLKRVGLEAIEIGIQTTNKEICEKVFERKQPEREILLEKIREVLKLGVLVDLDFIIDNPYMCDEDYEKDFDFLFELMEKGVRPRIFPLAFFPNYPLTLKAFRDGKIDRRRIMESKIEVVTLHRRLHFYSQNYLWPLLSLLLISRPSQRFVSIRKCIKWMKKHRNFLKPVARYLYKFLVLLKLWLERLEAL